MSDFHSSRNIKAVRRGHVCEQCGRKIDVGSPAEYGSGKYDGYIYSNYVHVECHAAAKEYADLNGLFGEEWPWFQDMDDADFHDWLLEAHPIVAGRLNIRAKERA